MKSIYNSKDKEVSIIFNKKETKWLRKLLRKTAPKGAEEAIAYENRQQLLTRLDKDFYTDPA